MIPMFRILVNNNSVLVREAISKDIYQIALMIGGDEAQKELIKVVDRSLSDPREAIQQGVLRNFHKFMSVFPQQQREDLLDVFLIV